MCEHLEISFVGTAEVQATTQKRGSGGYYTFTSDDVHPVEGKYTCDECGKELKGL